MILQEMVPLAPKTTMRIGGKARYFAEIKTKEDVEEVWQFAAKKKLPLIPLGSGSNTLFSEDTIEAVVARVTAHETNVEGTAVQVRAGKNLAMLVNELAELGLDMSPLTGIPGTVGGAIFGNAGQGPRGVWMHTYVVEVTSFIDGAWQTFHRDDCEFAYRDSTFKHYPDAPIIWEALLDIPKNDIATIKKTIATFLDVRIDTQPHSKTAGSIFKANGPIPAWQLLDAAGLRGLRIGDIEIAEKHANFLINCGQGRYREAKAVVERVQEMVRVPLEVEMRFIEPNGDTAF